MSEFIPTEENRLERLHRVIEGAQGRIDAEFERTRNTWITCFGSVVFQLETGLDLVSNKQLLPEDVLSRASEKVQKIKLRIHELHSIYGTRDKVVPDDIKQELLESLKVLS